MEREWIDYHTVQEIVALLKGRFNDEDIALGKSAATIAQVLVALIVQVDNENNKQMLIEIIRFAAELFNDGWEIPKDLERAQ
jgi:hypothetical protein